MQESPLSVLIQPPSSTAVKPTGIAKSAEELYQASSFMSDSNRAPTTTSLPSQTTEPLEITLQIDESTEPHHSRIRRQEFYWGNNEPNRTLAQDDLAAEAPLDGLALIKAAPSTVWARIVRKNQDDVDTRKSLREVFNEGTALAQRSTPSHDVFKATINISVLGLQLFSGSLGLRTYHMTLKNIESGLLLRVVSAMDIY
ncbi:hypothetical protein FH972_025225 [Carpinus fangiana]|uniref:Uncharacterized protein n=1 Tax=Carpinus fangiana TaxID=176857 RepID=A0A5N6L0E4_9ROSI|nr:hypothetical protein FH972_025225 [Carpinus fangiana]